jgi:UDP-N-acetylmuramyl pentapeptide phosphotransferase/UDP-N-acetylglucosamine-1-phosphate transferase
MVSQAVPLNISMNLTLNFFLLSIGAFILSYISVAAIQRWTVLHNLLDFPNERSSHIIPTPRGGGLALVIVTIISIGLLYFIGPRSSVNGLSSIFLGAILVAGVSLWDDFHPLPYWIRLLVHLVVAGIVVIEVGYWRVFYLPFIGAIYLGWTGLPVTIFWVVGMINAYNFMDGVDGIAGGQGVIAGLGWAVFGMLSGQSFIASVGVVLAASCLGFLGHNWPPAKIFMGDVGSTFLGYTFAVLPVVAGQHDTQLSFIGVLLVWPFIFDTAATFLRRLVHNENIFSAHLSHFYQRLVATGFSHKKIASLYIGLSIISLGCSTALFMKWHWADNLVVLIMVTMSLSLWLGTRRRERTVLKV